MNMPTIDRSSLRLHIAEVERCYPLKFLGVLPSETAWLPPPGDGVVMLAEAGDELSLLGLAKAQIDLEDRLGRAVTILTMGGLKGQDAERIPALARPL
jgi:hypothetical protein